MKPKPKAPPDSLIYRSECEKMMDKRSKGDRLVITLLASTLTGLLAFKGFLP